MTDLLHLIALQAVLAALSLFCFITCVLASCRPAVNNLPHWLPCRLCWQPCPSSASSPACWLHVLQRRTATPCPSEWSCSITTAMMLPAQSWPQGESPLMPHPVILPFTCSVTLRETKKRLHLLAQRCQHNPGHKVNNPTCYILSFCHSHILPC